MCIRVLLADPHGVLRDSLPLLLEKSADLRVVGTAHDGIEAVRLARLHAPRIAILESSMPGLGGIEATRAIKRVAPHVGVIILSAQNSSELVRQAIRAGASGYLSKRSTGEELVRAVRTVAAGRRYVGTGIPEVVLEEVARTGHAGAPLDALTAREREVLRLIAEGLSSREAARLLKLSPRSVETYRGRLMHKLHLRNIQALVKFAIRHGLVSPD